MKKIIIVIILVFGVFLTLPFIDKSNATSHKLPKGNNGQYYDFSFESLFTTDDSEEKGENTFLSSCKKLANQIVSYYSPTHEQDTQEQDIYSQSENKNIAENDFLEYLTNGNETIDPNKNNAIENTNTAYKGKERIVRQRSSDIVPVNGLYEISGLDSQNIKISSSNIYNGVMKKNKALPLSLYPAQYKLDSSNKMLALGIESKKDILEGQGNIIDNNINREYQEKGITNKGDIGKYERFNEYKGETMSTPNMPIESIEDSINKYFDGIDGKITVKKDIEDINIGNNVGNSLNDKIEYHISNSINNKKENKNNLYKQNEQYTEQQSIPDNEKAEQNESSEKIGVSQENGTITQTNNQKRDNGNTESVGHKYGENELNELYQKKLIQSITNIPGTKNKYFNGNLFDKIGNSENAGDVFGVYDIFPRKSYQKDKDEFFNEDKGISVLNMTDMGNYNK